MNALLICPDKNHAVSALGDIAPLANLPVFGKPLIEYWLERLMLKGAQDIHILAADRPEKVRAVVGNGSSWGLRVAVHPETHELTPDVARTKYRAQIEGEWLGSPDDATLINHLPGMPKPALFDNYAAWFAAMNALLPHAATPERIGIREIKPGVWVGLHSHIAPDAVLKAPCWIGENVFVGPRAVVGPSAILENRVCVERDSEIVHSVVGTDTFVGRGTEVRCSIAWGSTLINWRMDSCIKVAEPYLLCSLERHAFASLQGGVASKISAVIAALLPSSKPRGQFGSLLQPVITEGRQP
jgi:NDP-sugar pyrophosphorylase family protein